jgi:biotin carboxylase
MQKKLMVLGAGILQLPAIIAAKKMGLEVLAADIDRNAVGFRYADVCIPVSTTDILGIVRSARRHAIDGIMTLATDMPVRSAAAAAKALHLPGISEETAMRATNKFLMRTRLKEMGIPVPGFYCAGNTGAFRDAAARLKGKFIVKPADNAGSRGVFLVEDPRDTKTAAFAFAYAMKHSLCGEVVLEEFMEGPEVSVEALSVGGCAHVVAVTDKLTFGPPGFVERGHSQPSQLPAGMVDEIKKTAVKAVWALGIEEGPSHTEIIVTGEGPKIVEIGARLGGDNITTHLVPLSTGVDLVGCCIRAALGETPDLKIKNHAGSAIRYFNAPPGRIVSIRHAGEAEMLPGIRQVCFVKTVGETVGGIQNSTDRIGFVIAQCADAQSAIRACDEAASLIRIEIA